MISGSAPLDWRAPFDRLPCMICVLMCCARLQGVVAVLWCESDCWLFDGFDSGWLPGPASELCTSSIITRRHMIAYAGARDVRAGAGGIIVLRGGSGPAGGVGWGLRAGQVSSGGRDSRATDVASGLGARVVAPWWRFYSLARLFVGARLLRSSTQGRG